MNSQPLEAIPSGWDNTAKITSKLFERVKFTNKYALEAFELASGGEIGTGLSILDVATGGGALAVEIGQLIKEKNGKVTAIDFSLPMVEVASNHVKVAGLSNVEVKVMDGQVGI